MSMRLKKNDLVMVMTGKDRGKKAKIVEVSPATNRVVVEGLNLRMKNVRARREGEKGQRVQFAAAMHASNIQLVCPSCSKPTRIGVRRENDKPKRFCKKCKNVV